jgi:hypothetical protein
VSLCYGLFILLRVLAMAPNHPQASEVPSPSATWSPVVNGLQIQLVTDKQVYRQGEPIRLLLLYRNRDALPWVIRADSTQNRSTDAPLYTLSPLTVVRLASDQEKERRHAVVAIQSTRFSLEHFVRIEPGAVHTATGMLTSWYWHASDETDPLTSLPPGTYTITAQYGSLGYKHPSAEDQKRLRRFFAGADVSLEAFLKEKPMGLSYRDALMVRDCQYRIWSGQIDTPTVQLVIKGAQGAR